MLRIESATEKSQILHLHYVPVQDDITLLGKEVQSRLANLLTPLSLGKGEPLGFGTTCKRVWGNVITSAAKHLGWGNPLTPDNSLRS